MKLIPSLLTLALLLLILFTVDVLPAQAAFCRTVSDRTLCILDIQRSAKNYWEYRAIVSINHVKRPLEIYNCRDRVRIQPDGAIVPFEPKGAGELICSLFR